MRFVDRLGVVLVALICAAGADQHARADSTTLSAEQETLRAVDETLGAQLEVLAKTERILREKYRTRSSEMRARVRAAYKLLRPGWTPLWVDEQGRANSAQRRAMVRRVLSRERAELALLRDEMESVFQARQRIESERRTAKTLQPPAPGSLRRPVAYSRVLEPFGNYRHESSQTRLSRRGIVLSSRPGRNVRAVADGEVRYAGQVRGLGHAVIVDHGHFWSILGRVEPGRVVRASKVKRGEIIGESIGDRVYLEIRLEIDAGGFPVDPQPLIDWDG